MRPGFGNHLNACNHPVSPPQVGNRAEKGFTDSCLSIEHDVYLTGQLRRRGPGTPQARQPVAAGELIHKHSLKQIDCL